MIIYFAGCTGTKDREELILNKERYHRLFSYHLHVRKGEPIIDFKVFIESLKNKKD